MHAHQDTRAESAIYWSAVSLIVCEGLSVGAAAERLGIENVRLRNILRELTTPEGIEPVSYVLIDCPPSLNLLTINALAAADAVMVPLQCEFFALEGLSQLLRTVEQVRGALNP